MGRNLSNHSQSPVRGRGSPHRKSPSRRERSPARHRSSHRDGSPPREKRSSHAKSPKRQISHSPSPPAWRRSSQRESPPQAREKISSQKSRSPSPRTKRLKKAQAEKEVETLRDREGNHGKGDDKGSRRERETEKLSEREHEKSHGRGNDKGKHREREADKVADREYERNHSKGSDKKTQRDRDADRENGAERTERRSGRDATDSKSLRARNGRSISPSDHHHRSKHKSRSPQRDAYKRERDEVTNSRGTERRNDNDDPVAKMKAAEEALEAKQKQQPSFELSGKLAAETNRFRGVTLLFNEPPDARKPDVRWRLYVFKNGEVLNEPLYIHRQSCYLFGRERRVADIPTDHPSCSKQHAVIQFRQIEKEQPDGTLSKQPRICIVARELSQRIGIDLHHYVSPSSARKRFKNILLVYDGFVLRIMIP
ncbi:FHA domain-containing protein DDL isoform X2 [Jatropha curcas]|uniref:FHA domain-containing protein DDL isoform X2 n=1 Tax=Jatropha curcas TaxID=180498 RepID=UPI0005FBB862|nr:FHA domain-containing protein DDL isoform X2 [Jatropha curcas]